MPRRQHAFRALLLLLALLVGCGRPTAPDRPWPETTRRALVLARVLEPRPVPGTWAWLGGDVASSAELADGRVAWIFGDTLLGRVRADCPPPVRYCERDVDDQVGMIANSVGVMRRSAHGDPTPLEPYWRTVDGLPADAIASPHDGEFLWPMALRAVGSTLIATASRHTRASGLYSLGSMLARVRDASGPPAAWGWALAPAEPSWAAGLGRPQLAWTTALVPSGEYVYVVGARDVGLDAESLLARFPAAALAADAWAPELEFLHDVDGGTAWSRPFDPARVHVVEGLPGTSEATIDWWEPWGWYTFRIPAGAYEIRLYTAPRLAGPWRDRGVVHRIPAPWSTALLPDGRPRYAVYAVKAHPWLVAPPEAVLTYNVNLLSGSYRAAVDAAEREHGFYVPQVVRVVP